MTRQFSRREILRAAALGGVFIAGEFWFPGQKLISIPRRGTRVRLLDGSMIIFDDWLAFTERNMWIPLNDQLFISLHTGCYGVKVDDV